MIRWYSVFLSFNGYTNGPFNDINDNIHSNLPGLQGRGLPGPVHDVPTHRGHGGARQGGLEPPGAWENVWEGHQTWRKMMVERGKSWRLAECTSGKLTFCCGKLPFFMGKLAINGLCPRWSYVSWFIIPIIQLARCIYHKVEWNGPVVHQLSFGAPPWGNIRSLSDFKSENWWF